MDDTTLSALAAFPAQLEAHYAAMPPEYRRWAPSSWEGVPSEPLTALEQICHVRDIEIEGYLVRLRRTLREEHPLLPSLDTEALVRERNYAAAEPEIVFAAFRLARAETLKLLSSVSAGQWRRTAHFEGYGEVTLRALAHYLCSHDQQHLAGLQWLMGKIEAARLRNHG